MTNVPVTPWVTPTLIAVQSALSTETQSQAAGMGWLVVILGVALAARLFVVLVNRGRGL